MKLYTYSAEQSKAAACPFCDEYTQDSSVYYHGTSSHAEKEIEKEGLIWKRNTYTLEEINSVTQVFEELYWAGSHTGGFAVLASFTQSDFDLGNGNSKGISFARGSGRAMLYASKEWSGGETARALRYAFEDLERYLEDAEFRHNQMLHSWEELRASLRGVEIPKDCQPEFPDDIRFEHIRNLWRFYSTFGVRAGVGLCNGIEPVDFSAEWLHNTLRKLQPLRDRVCRLTSEYGHGAVYAVRLIGQDVVNAIKRSNGELYLKQLLPPERIIAKAIIPAELTYNPDHLFRDTEIFLARLK